MMLLKNWLAVLCFLLGCLQSKAQLFRKYPAHQQSVLIASNGKTSRKYIDGRDLKIHYHSDGKIIKSKGRLLIGDNDTIELVLYRRKKPFVVMNTDSIVSISRWNRKGKTTLIGLTVAGTVAAVVGGLATPRAVGEGVLDDPLPLLLFIGAAVDAYAIAVATPIVFISEWLSVRSEKNGYHFHVE